MSVSSNQRVWTALVAVHEWLITDLLHKINHASAITDDDFQPFHDAVRVLAEERFNVDTKVFDTSKTALEDSLRTNLLEFFAIVNQRIEAATAGGTTRQVELLERMGVRYNALVKEFEDRLHATKAAIEEALRQGPRIQMPALEYVGGSVMVDSTDKSVHIGHVGGSITGVIGADNLIRDSFNTVQNSGADDEVKAKLTDLSAAVAELCKALPSSQAEDVARDFKDFTGEAVSNKPRRGVLEALGNGLSEAAKAVEKVGPPVAILVKAVVGLF
jgi:hypothetical protein